MKITSFDIWGAYAHYKKIYATTSAITYPFPTKTSLYGYVGAVLGLPKEAYLESFPAGACLMGIRLMRPPVMQRIATNLRAETGPLKEGGNRKPTLMEYVRAPLYRIYMAHQDAELYEAFKISLIEKKAVFTPCLGLAGLVSNFAFVGETDAEAAAGEALICSVIPKQFFQGFLATQMMAAGNELVETSMYPIEMDAQRNVTRRDDILYDRTCKAVPVKTTRYYKVSETENVVLF